MPPVCPKPGAAQHEDVAITIVVIVRVHHVQPAHNSDKTGLFGPFCKSPIAVVAEELHLIAQPPRRLHNVEEPVVIKVLHDRTTGMPASIQPHFRRNIDETPNIEVRLKYTRPDEPL